MRSSRAADSRRSSSSQTPVCFVLVALATPHAGAARRRVPPAISNRSRVGFCGAWPARLPRAVARLPQGRPWLRRRVRHPLGGASLGGSAALRSRRVASTHGAPGRAASPRPPFARSPPRFVASAGGVPARYPVQRGGTQFIASESPPALLLRHQMWRRRPRRRASPSPPPVSHSSFVTRHCAARACGCGCMPAQRV